ncbi:MAG: hypothetical protein ABSD59_20445 [Terracidiphilus sp.]|jgi:hypothetical protein
MSSISGLGSNADYVTNAQSRSTAASVTTSSAINLNAGYIQSVDNGMVKVPDPSNAGSLFSFLNLNILDENSLAGVGSAIDTYTSSLSSSNVYDSSYTTPSAKYLTDLTSLKTSAASGNINEAQADLATAKLAAPDSVAGGISTAISEGDTAGEAGLIVEGTANFSGYLATQGYSSKGASAEASAITINGLSEDAMNTPSSSAQTRSQQITNLALYTADNPGTTSSSPLLNVISALLVADGNPVNGFRDPSGTAIDQSLTNLVALYGGSPSNIPANSA